MVIVVNFIGDQITGYGLLRLLVVREVVMDRSIIAVVASGARQNITSSTPTYGITIINKGYSVIMVHFVICCWPIATTVRRCSHGPTLAGVNIQG